MTSPFLRQKTNRSVSLLKGTCSQMKFCMTSTHLSSGRWLDLQTQQELPVCLPTLTFLFFMGNPKEFSRQLLG